MNLKQNILKFNNYFSEDSLTKIIFYHIKNILKAKIKQNTNKPLELFQLQVKVDLKKLNHNKQDIKHGVLKKIIRKILSQSKIDKVMYCKKFKDKTM